MLCISFVILFVPNVLSLSLTRCAYSDKLLFISAVFAIIMKEYSGYSNNSKILGNCDNDKALARRQQ